MGDADHQHGEHQRRDDHLDQAQENRSVMMVKYPATFAASFGSGNGRVQDVPDHDTEDHSAQNPIGEALRHSPPSPHQLGVETSVRSGR